MAGKKTVEAYRTEITNLEIRVYDSELRKLFKLPVRKGKIESAEFSNGRLEIKFVNVKGNQFNI